jgi:hypothetical protein
MTLEITTPQTSEYAEFYAGYIQRAQARGNVFAALASQIDELRSALGNLSDEQARFKPGPQEWSFKEVVGHLNDGERVFSYRLLRISRNDPTPLPGFEQDDYVRNGNADDCSLADLLQEFEFLRRANIIAIKNMRSEALLRLGTASGFPVSARALIHIMVGHVEHHMASFHEVYFPALNKHA